ncbi:hypothetical protein HMPREF3190_00855 [Umbribacter vaginalis]|nr:hypothetical protein HMPREF3190_00855 [Coriobacteriales bacterium DNF00809]
MKNTCGLRRGCACTFLVPAFPLARATRRSRSHWLAARATRRLRSHSHTIHIPDAHLPAISAQKTAYCNETVI